MLDNYKVLVTGSTGFVGQHLCQTLKRENIEYIAAVRNIANSNEFKVENISHQTNWLPYLKNVSAIIHLAARVHVMNETHADPLKAFRDMNVDATLALAKQAIEAGVKRFIYISSIKVNGEETFDTPFTSFDTPKPVDFYGQSKFEAEQALQSLSKETGLELVIIRPPLIYGPNVKANFQKLVKLVAKGLPLPLGKINNRRSMVSLDNLVDLIVTCISHPKAANQVFMVSDDDDVSLSRLLKLIAYGMNQNLILLPAPITLFRLVAKCIGKEGVVDRLLGSLQVDISHTKSTLGWKPIIGVEESIVKTVDSFQK